MSSLCAAWVSRCVGGVPRAVAIPFMIVLAIATIVTVVVVGVECVCQLGRDRGGISVFL